MYFVSHSYQNFFTGNVLFKVVLSINANKISTSTTDLFSVLASWSHNEVSKILIGALVEPHLFRVGR